MTHSGLVGWHSNDPFFGSLLQGTGSNTAHQVTGAGQGAEGMADYCDVAEVSHVRDTGTLFPVRDVQNLSRFIHFFKDCLI